MSPRALALLERRRRLERRRLAVEADQVRQEQGRLEAQAEAIHQDLASRAEDGPPGPLTGPLAQIGAADSSRLTASAQALAQEADRARLALEALGRQALIERRRHERTLDARLALRRRETARRQARDEPPLTDHPTAGDPAR